MSNESENTPKETAPVVSAVTPKKAAHAGNAILYTLFIVGGIVAVNLISTRLFGRIDLTDAKVYTISNESRALVKALPDYMNVKVFISEDLPPELKTVGRYLRDTISEYATASNKFRWEAIDPATDEEKKQVASDCQVQPMQIQVMREGKFEVGTYYLGMCLEFNDKKEAIPQVAQAEGLEYQITSLIKKLTQGKKKVAFATGHGEIEPNAGLQALKQVLDAEFETSSVDLSNAQIGADIDALFVGGPKQALDEKALREIDRFIMSGKGAILLVDGMAMTSPNMGGMQMPNQPQIKMGQANQHGMGPLLEGYGFKVHEDFIFEPESVAMGAVPMNGQMMMLQAPPFAFAQLEEKSELSFLNGLRGVVFPFSSSVELVGNLKNGTPAGAKLWRIAASTPEAWRHTGFFILNPTEEYKPSNERGPFAYGYAYQGKLKSAFAGAAPPPTLNDAVPPPAGESAKPVRLLVMGDSDFTNDEFVGMSRHPLFQLYQNGAILALGAVRWVVEDETLTPLRNKTMSARPITFEGEMSADVMRWGNVVGLPFAFCMFGVVRWRIRRTRRNNMKL
ncbi:MAG: GldG family protein [Deltaproteobacteria bacterium]|nr:GldG family protein [Deltaproteobacteria bacterium]